MYQVATSLGADYVKHLLSAVVLSHGGRREEADVHLGQMIKIYGEALQSASLDRREERQAFERMQDRSLTALQDVVARMQPQARQIVAPIGRSSEVLKISGGDYALATEIDVAIADAVRAGGDLRVGDMEQFEVLFDGLSKQSRSAKVEIVSGDGRLIPADIRDPVFDDFPNIYTNAFGDERTIVVWAKPTFREEILVKLHILSAV